MTKEERNTAYRKAIGLIKSGANSYLCTAISTASSVPIHSGFIKSNFPELYSFKPEKVQEDLMEFKTWFGHKSKENTKKRIEVLEECIKLTN